MVIGHAHRLDGEKNPILAAALQLAEFGFYIYPSPKKKGAARVKWRLNSTRDSATITGWWTRWPHDLICLDCGKSKVAVVDADSVEGHGFDGLSTLLDLELEHGMLPGTRKARTPSGGQHFLFSDPESKMKSTVGVLGPGVDTRGVGGMVVLPPSVVKGKGAYQWTNDLPLADIPQWVIDKAGASRQHEPAPDAEFEPAYSQKQFEERLKLIDVDQFSRKHDDWLAFMLACTHSSTVADGKAAFIQWTTRNGEGEYASDADLIEARWDYNNRNHHNKGGKAYKVGTFNKYLIDAGHADLVLQSNESSAEDDFAEDVNLDTIKVQGDPQNIAREVAEREQIKIEAAAGKARPVVRVLPSFLHVAMDETQAVLIEQSRKSVNKNGGSTISDQIFQRDGRLVRLNRNLHVRGKNGLTVPADTQTLDGVTVDHQYQERKALTILEIRAPWLATRLNRSIQYVGPSAGKPGKKPRLKPRDVPLALVNQLLGDETQWQFSPLFSTIEAPTLRADGAILDEPGYDPESGMFFDPGDTLFPKIKLDPTIAEGKAAIKFIDDEILDCFPFVDQPGYEGVSRSVALAMMLTGPVRRGLPIAPAFAADSNEPESGKSQLLKAAGALMTGREIAGRPFSDSEEERRKALGTAYLEGRPVLFFDNVVTIIEGAALEMALTTSVFEDRKLGSHEGIVAPTNSLTLFSANHVSVGGNGMTTRILVSRIVPTKPLAQRLKDGDFRHPNLINYVIENRPKLIAAVLTALRAFIIHGQGEMPPSISRFPEWGRLIGNALIWYDYADPTRGGDALRQSDPVKEAQRDVMRQWLRIFRRHPVAAADLCSRPEMRAAIGSLLGKRPQALSSHEVSGYVTKMVGVQLDQPYIVETLPRQSGHHAPKRWRLVQVIADDLLPDPTA